MDEIKPSRWDLQQLLPAPAEQSLELALSQVESKLRALEAKRSTLGMDFLASLDLYEDINALSQRLSAYATLWFSEDTQNPDALNLRGRVEHALTAVNNRTLFFSLWFKNLADNEAQRLIEISGDRRYFLESLRRFKPYTLSESEEQVINLKDPNGIDALVKVYDMITNRFKFNLEVDGEQKTLTRDQLSAYFHHFSPEIRASAYQELYRVYGENTTLLAQIYNHRIRDWHAEGIELRHYAQPISARNIANDLPDAVVDVLLSVCRKNNHIFQRYFKQKAGWLQMDKLRRYDIYAPLIVSGKTYTYSQAVETVLSSFHDFSPIMAEQVEKVISLKHLDAEARPGKRGGAFCYSVLPTLVPWVLTNFAGKIRDVSTLAHELGHAIHAQQAVAHSPLTYHAPLPLAETASVFGEMLLSERLLKEESDPAIRRDLLASTIDDAYATVHRQAYFTLFEREAHHLVMDGKTFDDLAAAYQANLSEQFGDAVEMSDEFRWEWICIPHFYHTPFYTYAYAFGQLLVLALYAQYKREGEQFKPRYFKILSYGGSKAPSEILAEAGFQIELPAFWQGGYDVLEKMVSDLENMPS